MEWEINVRDWEKGSREDIFRSDISLESDLILQSVNLLSKQFKLLHK